MAAAASTPSPEDVAERAEITSPAEAVSAPDAVAPDAVAPEDRTPTEAALAPASVPPNAPSSGLQRSPLRDRAAALIRRLAVPERWSSVGQRVRSVPLNSVVERLTTAEQRPRLLAALAVAVVALAAVVLSGSVRLPSSTAARDTPSNGQTAVPAERVITDSFDAGSTGSDPGWEMISSRQDAGTAAIAPLPTSVDRSVRLTLRAADQSFSACRTMPAVQSGVLLAQAVVLVDGFGRGATSIATVSSGGSEVARLRVGPGGEIQLADEASRGGTATLAANAWYDIAFQIDIPSQTYGLTVRNHGSSTVVSQQDRLRWIGQLGGGLDRVCFAPPAGVAGRSVYVSDLRVTAR